MAYIGNTAGNRFVASKAATQFSGDGSNTSFTLEHSVSSDEDILVSVDGVIQEPSVAYAVSNGTTLTFTEAPSNNSGNNIFVYYLFRTVATVDHPSTSSLQATDGTFTGAVTANAGVNIDNITIDGTEIDLSSGNLTLDVAGQLVINSDSGQVVLQDDTVNWGNLQNSSGDFIIGSLGADKDLKIQGLDGSSTIDALTFDMSDGGAATFAKGITLTNGNIAVANGNGIDFSAASGSASGSSSAVLDDYEEGTWTPAFDDAGGGTFGYGSQSGTYTKIGRLVYCQFNIVVNSVSGLSGSIMRITGQPFSSNSDENMFVSRYQGFTSGAPHRGNASGSSSVNIKSEGTNDNGNFPSSNTTSSSQLIGQIMFTTP